MVMKIKKVLLYLVILIVLIVLFDKVLMPYIVGREEVRVPNVVGMTYEQGKLILEQNNLEPTFGGERYDSKYPKGTIILQRPTANKTVKVGRRIYLIISSGNVKVEVPNIRYKSVEEANIILSRSDLAIGQIFEDTLTDVPKGLITSQSINPGEMVEKGTSINIWVSSASSTGNIEVPDLVGRSFSDVQQIIKSKNLRVGKVVYQPSIEYLPNTVIYQYPASGSYVQELTPIDLIVVKEKISGKEIIE